MKLSVYPVYSLLTPQSLEGAAALVIDTLRMTSVAAVALGNGCAGLRVVCEVEQARALARETGALLGGERQALRIAGFDFSNSPLEYTAEKLRGRRLVMTTSNGTRAIQAALGALEVYLGCLMNASAAARALEGRDALAIVLAGTGGRFSLEDAVTAGAVIARLGPGCELDDMALAALCLYERARGDMHAFLSPTAHYRKLARLGFSGDLRLCLTEDAAPCLPRLCGDGWFRAAGAAAQAPEKQNPAD